VGIGVPVGEGVTVEVGVHDGLGVPVDVGSGVYVGKIPASRKVKSASPKTNKLTQQEIMTPIEPITMNNNTLLDLLPCSRFLFIETPSFAQRCPHEENSESFSQAIL
jgi:hypothetical protein